MPSNSSSSKPLPESLAWHALDAGAVAGQLAVSPDCGLDSETALARLQEQGANCLARKPPRSLWLKFADQFKSLLILTLLVAALVAGALGDIKDAVVILVVVVLNACLGFYQEHRAEAALAALKSMLAPTARVRRDGEVQVVAAETLVSGDVILLEAGDRIPADARVLAAYSAEVAEAALTGESAAVEKQSEALAADTPLAERSNCLYMNTVVTRGRIEAVVTATAMATEMGQLAGLLSATAEAATPLQEQLNQLGKRLAAIAGAVVTLIFVLGVARGQGLADTALTAIALAVAAIPEGLPAVVTVTLALGMQRMAKRNAVVKKLAAVETLGCTTVICSDKTGTLTLNRMTARRCYFAGRRFVMDAGDDSGQGVPGVISSEDGAVLPDWTPLLPPLVLCTDAQWRDGVLIGDPTEGALLALAARLAPTAADLVATYPRIAEIPFDSRHKFMATFHRDGDRVQLWLKGAPDVVLPRSAARGEQGGDYEAENIALADQALRVIALAGRRIPQADFEAALARGDDLMVWAEDLELVGLVGIIDPPRPEAREAIRFCHQAGIAVKMITGDHRATAAAIARDLGLAGEVHEGRELDGLSAADLRALVQRTVVFARVAPEHKMRIVQALQALGHVVAMTGDGVNDAPALKAADIGIAMGITGTAVTREAATMVLSDDNFATIVGAVREGRTIYDNIVKFVRFQLSTNIGAILTVLGAPLLGLPTPFNAIQILWVNIIMDGPPAMTLGVEPSRPGIMSEPPRNRADAILGGHRLLRIGLYGLTMAVGTLAAYWVGLHHLGEVHDGRYAGTLAFTTFVLFQFFNIFNARADLGSAFNAQFFKNGKLWSALGLVLLLQVVAVHWTPAQALFDTTDLSLPHWGLAVAIAATTLLLEEARKLICRLWGRRGK